MKGPFGAGKRPDIRNAAEQVREAVIKGMKTLKEDVEIVPGSQVQMFDLFDIENGDHVMIWRVACREIAGH